MRTRFAPSLLAIPAFAIACAALCVPGVARADDEADRGQARALGQAAYDAASKGDWAKAEDLFHKADSLFHASTLLLGLARARAHLGKYVEAWEDYHRIIIETLPPNAGPALKKAVEDAKTEIATVEGKQAHATLSVTGLPATTTPRVTLDGVPVGVAALGTARAVNPGSHTLHAEADGFKPADATFTVAEGASTTASVALEPAPAPAPAAPAPEGTTPAPGAPPPPAGGDEGNGTMRTLGLVGMGVGGAGIVTGIVTGIVAMGQHSSLQGNACANAGCGASDLSSYKSSVSSYQTMGTVSTVSFIAGGVLAAGGAVLFFFVAPKHQEAGAAPATAGLWVTPYVGLGSAGAAGTF
jgi:hypothetical protein